MEGICISHQERDSLSAQYTIILRVIRVRTIANKDVCAARFMGVSNVKRFEFRRSGRLTARRTAASHCTGLRVQCPVVNK